MSPTSKQIPKENKGKQTFRKKSQIRSDRWLCPAQKAETFRGFQTGKEEDTVMETEKHSTFTDEQKERHLIAFQQSENQTA